jgi:hypothetical protein
MSVQACGDEMAMQAKASVEELEEREPSLL